jgi:hypothetical protein
LPRRARVRRGDERDDASLRGRHPRRRADFTAMLDDTGWRLERIVRTASPLSVLVAAPA